MALLAQDLSGGALGSRLNYTLCMDVAKSSYSITCIKGTPCPPGQDVAKAVYAGDGETYNVDWSGKCTKVACPHPRCDPPDGMPFSFLLLDDDSRGVAKRVRPHPTAALLAAAAAGTSVLRWLATRAVG